MEQSDDPKGRRGKLGPRSGQPSDRERAGDYDIGYGKPPATSRWRKGQSGNPHGRPRKKDKEPFSGKINPVLDVILEELARPVIIKEGGETLEIETVRAVMRSATVGAMKGNRYQQKLILEIAQATEEARRLELKGIVCDVESYKARWTPIFEQERARGGPEPRQLPHPDHLNIDPATCDLVISGPLNKAQKEYWEYLKFQLRETAKLVAQFRQELAENPRGRQEKERAEVSVDFMAQLEKQVPEGWNWREELGWEEVFAKRFLAT